METIETALYWIVACIVVISLLLFCVFVYIFFIKKDEILEFPCDCDECVKRNCKNNY